MTGEKMPMKGSKSLPLLLYVYLGLIEQWPIVGTSGSHSLYKL